MLTPSKKQEQLLRDYSPIPRSDLDFVKSVGATGCRSCFSEGLEGIGAAAGYQARDVPDISAKSPNVSRKRIDSVETRLRVGIGGSMSFRQWSKQLSFHSTLAGAVTQRICAPSTGSVSYHSARALLPPASEFHQADLSQNVDTTCQRHPVSANRRIAPLFDRAVAPRAPASKSRSEPRATWPQN